MRKLLSFFLFLALIFVIVSVSNAVTIAPDLQSALESLGPEEEIPIIITLSDKVDIKALKKDFKDRRSMRAGLIKALKSKADVTQGRVRYFLETAKTKKIKQFWIINGIAATVHVEQVEQIARLPGVESVFLDAVIHAPEVTPAEAAPPEWNIEKVKASDLWAYGIRGQEIVVANMDTGVDINHLDVNLSWRGGANSWYDPNNEHPTVPYDANGHGTGTMGIMVGGDAGGTAIGVAPQAKWIAVKIFNDAGGAFLSGIVDGFQWLLDPDNNPDTNDAPDVVNNSWGYDAPNKCINSGAYAVLQTSIQNLKASGIAVVFSAGNSGPYASTSVSPANYPESFAVGATDMNDYIAYFSSRGPSTCDGEIYPEVVAPGVSIKTSYRGSYAFINGTSFSAPHVAGAMALLRSAFPDVSVPKMELALRRSAVDLGPEGVDNNYGYGLLDISVAYSLLLDHGVTNPYLEVIKTGKGEGTVVSDIGSILCGVDCFDSYDPGTVTLTALPAGGSHFGKWSGCTSVNSNQCIVSVNDDTTVTAQFWGNSIQVMKPVEGEIVPSGSRTTVTWVSPSNADHFTVKYSPDNGTTWLILAQNVADVKYLWSVPKPLQKRKYNLLNVVGYTKTGLKVGSAVSGPFSIEVVKLTNPNSSPTPTIFTSGETIYITWTANETKRPIAKVILEYTKNSGQTWVVIDRLTGDRLTEFNGSHSWKVPDVSGTKEKCKVRVRLKDSAGNEIGRDASDNYFTINYY